MLKLNPARGLEYELHEIRTMEPGPERMLLLVELLRKDLERFPLDVDPPAAVRKAHEGFAAACSWAQGIADEIAAAEDAAKTAQAADVMATAEAMRDSKDRPDLSQFKAGQDVTGAIVGVQAAERLLEDAHGRLVDAAHKAWPKWRRLLLAAAGDAHAAAASSVSDAAAAVVAARDRYGAVTAVDAEMTGRVPEAKQARVKEFRGLVNWYEATHDARRPLNAVAIPGQTARGKPVMVDLAVMLEACVKAVSREAHFGPIDWVPLGDEDHDKLLAEPLDLEAPWVVQLVSQVYGGKCALCRAPGTTVIEEGGTLKLFCKRCGAGPLDPKALRRAERMDRQRREGFPGSGSLLDDELREGRDQEREKTAREDAHAAALGELGGGNAETIAKRQER